MEKSARVTRFFPRNFNALIFISFNIIVIIFIITLERRVYSPLKYAPNGFFSSDFLTHP